MAEIGKKSEATDVKIDDPGRKLDIVMEKLCWYRMTSWVVVMVHCKVPHWYNKVLMWGIYYPGLSYHNS